MKRIKFNALNSKKKGGEKMRNTHLTKGALLVVALGILALVIPQLAQATELTPATHTTSLIDYTRNIYTGVLIGQTAYSLSTGVDINGQSFSSGGTTTFFIDNGDAYGNKETTIQVSFPDENSDGISDDGSWTRTVRTVNYLRDSTGKFTGTGATGTQTVTSYNPAGGSASTTTGSTTIQKGDLTFALIDGTPEQTAWTYQQATFDGEKGTANAGYAVTWSALVVTTGANTGKPIEGLQSYGQLTTTYAYSEPDDLQFRGITKTVGTSTTGIVWDFTGGTLPAGTDSKASCPLAGLTNAVYPAAVISSGSHNAYDANGSLIPTSSAITRVVTPNADGTTTTKLYIKINGVDVEKTITEVIASAQANNCSYSFSSSGGVQFSDQSGWLTYTSESFTLLRGINGALQTSWTASVSDAIQLQFTPPAGVDPIIQGTVLNVVNVGANSNAQTVWVFVRDNAGLVWALRFTGNLATQAGNYEIGSSINVNGETIRAGNLNTNLISTTVIN